MTESPHTRLPLRRFIIDITDGPFGSSLTSSHYSEHGARVIRLGNIGEARFKDTDSVYVPVEYYRQLKRHEAKAGDLVIAGLGDGNHPVGRACIVPEKIGPAIVKADCFRVRLDQSRMTHRYAAWALTDAASSGYTAEYTRGSTRSRINLEIVRDIVLPVPPIDEQQRIADFLDAETTRIEQIGSLQKKLLLTLEEREQAYLDIAVDGLTEECGTAPLRRFVWRVDQGVSPQCDAIPAEEDEWGVLKVSCLRPGIFLPHENKRLPKDVTPHREGEIREGDLLITRANTPGLVGSTSVVRRVRPKLLLSDKIFRVSLSPELSPDFVSTVARGSQIRALCASSSNGASQSMANIRFEEVKAWPMPLANAGRQQEFVTKIATNRCEIEKMKPHIEAQIELLAERRQALIAAAVTGQFDVSTASGRGVTE